MELPVVLPTLRYLSFGLPLLLLSCSDPYPLQAKVRGLGDAINHCRGYTRHMLPPEAVISLDALSTREGRYFYDVFFSVTDGHDHGYVRCQIDMGGTIVNFDVRDFRQRSRSFSGFSF